MSDVTRTDPSNCIGTSLMGYIEATYTKLVETFGQPEPGTDKTQAEWTLNTPAGVATIYDWKEDAPYESINYVHVGGKNPEVVDYVDAALS